MVLIGTLQGVYCKLCLQPISCLNTKDPNQHLHSLLCTKWVAIGFSCLMQRLKTDQSAHGHVLSLSVRQVISMDLSSSSK